MTRFDVVKNEVQGCIIRFNGDGTMQMTDLDGKPLIIRTEHVMVSGGAFNADKLRAVAEYSNMLANVQRVMDKLFEDGIYVNLTTSLFGTVTVDDKYYDCKKAR
jgi:hypothetical protein